MYIYIYVYAYNMYDVCQSSSMQYAFSPGRRQLPRLHLPCTTQAPQTRAQDGTDEDSVEDMCLIFGFHSISELHSSLDK